MTSTVAWQQRLSPARHGGAPVSEGQPPEALVRCDRGLRPTSGPSAAGAARRLAGWLVGWLRHRMVLALRCQLQGVWRAPRPCPLSRPCIQGWRCTVRQRDRALSAPRVKRLPRTPSPVQWQAGALRHCTLGSSLVVQHTTRHRARHRTRHTGLACRERSGSRRGLADGRLVRGGQPKPALARHTLLV